MKIFIVSFGYIPSQWAHGINTVKHAQGFYELGHQVEICTVNRLYETLFKVRIKDVNKFYGISPKIKIETFTDNSIFYFRELIPHIFNNLDLKNKNNDEIRSHIRLSRDKERIY